MNAGTEGTADALVRLDALQHILSGRQKKPLADPSYIPAGVLLVLYPRTDGYHVLFQKRSDRVEHHKGEISLPGGAKDPEDHTLLHTALRETWEEVGIRPEHVSVLGELDDTPTRTRFSISTYVATIPHPYQFKINEESLDLLEVPVQGLLDPRNVFADPRQLLGGGPLMRVYAHEHHRIFGATARIVDQFLVLVRQAQKV